MIWSLAMNTVKSFSNELLNSIYSAIEEYQKNSPGPHYAAFDVDGTLWDSDIGENFFQYKIDHCELPALQALAEQGIDPWDHYHALKKKHPPDGYLWLAQICSGFSIAQVEKWAEEALEKFPLAVFEPQKKLISNLQKRGLEIFTVSASVQWSVAAAMPMLGLKKENALGVKTQILNGKVTTNPDGPVTWREGKARALLQRNANMMPIFCSGNTSGDIQLLELARGQALAVQSQTIEDSSHASLYADEQQLLGIAREKKWLTHSFK
jgi:phosphoserine phosphatase